MTCVQPKAMPNWCQQVTAEAHCALVSSVANLLLGHHPIGRELTSLALGRPWRLVAAYETRAECEWNTNGGVAHAGGLDLVFFLCLPDSL
jgi:hypothetical protein